MLKIIAKNTHNVGLGIEQRLKYFHWTLTSRSVIDFRGSLLSGSPGVCCL